MSMERKPISVREVGQDNVNLYSSYLSIPPQNTKEANNGQNCKGKADDFDLLPPCFPNEDETNRRLRKEALEICQSIVKEAYRTISLHIYTRYLRNLPKYLHGIQMQKPGTPFIPLALIEAGFHVCDRAALTRYIVNFLQSKCSRAVINLSAGECPNLSTIYTSIRRQLTGKRKPGPDDPACFLDELMDIMSSQKWRGNISKQRPESQIEDNSVPQPDKDKLPHTEDSTGDTQQSQSDPLVIVFGDPESFDWTLLNRLLEILAQRKERCPSLPIALVFVTHPLCGVPPSITRRAISQLQVQQFRLPGAMDVLRELIDELFFGPNRLPIMIGPKAYLEMKKSFQSSHYSVKKFLHQLEYLLSEHFSKPTSYLCMLANKKYMTKYNYDAGRLSQVLYNCAKPILHASDFDLKWFPSLCKETTPKHENKRRKSNSTPECILKVDEYVEEQHDRLCYFRAAALCLQESLKVCLLPADLKKFSWLGILEHLLAMDRFLSMIVEKIFAGLRQIPLKEVVYLVSKWNLILTQQSRDVLKPKEVEDLLKQTQQISFLLSKAQNCENDGNAQTIRDGLVGEVQLLLLEIIVVKNYSWCSGPFNEIWWFDDSSALEGAQVRACVIKALAHPVHYLRCKCCITNRASQQMQDTCIAYQIYESQGQRIEIDQWFEEFVEVVLGLVEGQEHTDGRLIDLSEQQGRLLWARFLQATAELSTLGFTIKQGKKTMSRLIYAYTMAGKP